MARQKITVGEEDLPLRMQAALHDMRTGQPRGMPAPKAKRLTMISYALRSFVHNARIEGFDEILTTETGARYEALLRSRGDTAGSIITLLSALRFYAYYAGEGVDWALASGGKDQRPAEVVLRAEHWRPLAERARSLLADGGVKLHDLKRVDRFLRVRGDRPALPEDEIYAFFDSQLSVLSKTYIALHALAPDDPDLPMIEALRGAVERARRGPPKPRQLPCTVSTPFDDRPDPIREKFLALSRRRRHGKPLLAPHTIASMKKIVRQLISSARNHGSIDEDLTLETIEIYIDDIDARNLAMVSRESYLNMLAMFADHAGYDPKIVEAINSEKTYYRDQRVEQSKRKEYIRTQDPITVGDIELAAHALMAAAPLQANAQRRRRFWLGAAAVGLLSDEPPRASDVLRLVLGHHIYRDDNAQWHLDFTDQKMGHVWVGPLAPDLTPLFDAAIRLGANVDEDGFWRLYRHREFTPFFCMSNGAQHSYWWLWRICIEAFNHSPHLARTVVHDDCAFEPSLGADAARRKLRQKSQRIAKEYEVLADARRIAAAGERWREIRKKLWRSGEND